MVIIMLLITTVYHVKLTCKWVTEPLVFHCQAGLQIKMYWERLVICLLSWLCRFLFSFCVGLNGGQLASHLFLLEPSLFNMLSTSTSHCHFLKTCSSPVKIYKINHSDYKQNVGYNSRKNGISQINQIHKFSWMNTVSTLSCIIHRNRTYIKTIPIFHFRKYQIRNATLENFDQGNLYKFKFK